MFCLNHIGVPVLCTVLRNGVMNAASIQQHNNIIQPVVPRQYIYIEQLITMYALEIMYLYAFNK